MYNICTNFQTNGCFVSDGIVVIVVYSNANRYAYLHLPFALCFDCYFDDDETIRNVASDSIQAINLAKFQTDM